MSDASSKSNLNSESRDLTTGPIWRVLASIATPMVLGLLAVLSVNLVDTFYVGQVGKDQLAALSFSFPVAFLFTSLCIGLGVGTASVVSRRTGEGEDGAARKASLDGILLSLLLTVIISAVMAILTAPLFTVLGADENVLKYILQYMPIYFMSIPFLAASLVLHNISRAVGEANWPTGIMMTSGLLNIAVTGVLVFGWGPFPELGIMGAALGTLIARASVVWASVWLVTRKLEMISWHIPKLSNLLPAWTEILSVAVPSATGNMINPLSNIVVTAILAGFAQSAVAGFGVATQVQSVSIIPLLAMSSALGPIAGQNWGADKPDRIGRTLMWAFGLCVLWAAIIAAVMWIWGDAVAQIFSDDAEVREGAAMYLRIVPISLFGYGMVIIAAAAFNAIDQATRGLLYYAFRSAIFLLPLAYVGSMIADVRGVYIGIAAANAISGLGVAAYAVWWLKRNQDKAGKETGA